MFNTDPHLMLDLHHQRSRKLREEAAASSLVGRLRARFRAGQGHGHHRRRAPEVP